jgi:hypothetical protein
MGGQACVFYGAAEFSRDVDLVILLDSTNLDRLREALQDLDATRVAIPSFDPQHLARGHAVHFRCRRPDVAGLRIDVMSRLRGVPPFDRLWERRTSIEVEGATLDLLSLPDLVLAKKTQRDKDWPMIRRLVEQSFFSARGDSPEQVEFWLAELRSPELLIELARRKPEAAGRSLRPAVRAALDGDPSAVDRELAAEENAERARDRKYWEPLKNELQEMRRNRRNTT